MSNDLSTRLDALETAIEGLATHLFGVEFAAGGGHMCWGKPCGKGEASAASKHAKTAHTALKAYHQSEKANSRPDGHDPRTPAQANTAARNARKALDSAIKSADPDHPDTKSAKKYQDGLSEQDKGWNSGVRHTHGGAVEHAERLLKQHSSSKKEFSVDEFGHKCWGRDCGGDSAPDAKLEAFHDHLASTPPLGDTARGTEHKIGTFVEALAKSGLIEEDTPAPGMRHEGRTYKDYKFKDSDTLVSGDERQRRFSVQSDDEGDYIAEGTMHQLRKVAKAAGLKHSVSQTNAFVGK